MIEEKYFDDTFLLNDETETDIKFINDLIEFINETNRDEGGKVKYNGQELKKLTRTTETDERLCLKGKWANMTRMMFFQPTWEIREYFGEKITFYYAWLGAIISTLWILSILGIASFAYGIQIG